MGAMLVAPLTEVLGEATHLQESLTVLGGEQGHSWSTRSTRAQHPGTGIDARSYPGICLQWLIET